MNNILQFAVESLENRLAFTIFSDGSGSVTAQRKKKINLNRDDIYLLRDKFVEAVRIIEENDQRTKEATT